MDLPVSFRIGSVNASNSGTRMAPSGTEAQDDSSSPMSITSFDSNRENSYRESENPLKRLADPHSEVLSQDRDNVKKVKIENDS